MSRLAENPVMRQAAAERDLACLRRLLRHFEQATTPATRRDALRLAIDLFDTHAQLHDRALDGNGRRRRARLFDLIESIEMTDPASKLYRARGAELKLHLEALLAEEERSGAPTATRNAALQQAHKGLLARADVFFSRHPTPPALIA